MDPRALFTVSIVTVVALVMSGCTGDEDDDPPRSSSESESPTTEARPSDTTASDSTSATGTDVAETSEDIDIGGRIMFLRCWGERVPGEPTVLLMAGHDLDTTSWEPMAGDFAADGHWVCSYDRAGIGRSDAAPEARRTTKDQVADLVGLLDGTDLEEPLVLVAHSAGSLPAIGLAARAPDRIAGVVFVDPVGPRVSDALRAALPPEKPGESPELADERSFLTEFRLDPTKNREHLVFAASEREAAAWLDQPGPVFGDDPVVVLQAPREDVPGLPDRYVAAADAVAIDGNKELAAESKRGTVVEVEDTGHLIMTDRPDAVIDAILDVIAG